MSISKNGEDPTSYEKPSWIIYVLVEYMASTNTICVCLKQEYNWNWGENNNYIKRQILKRREEKKESNMWLWKKNVQLMLHCSRLKCFTTMWPSKPLPYLTDQYMFLTMLPKATAKSFSWIESYREVH